MWICLAALIIAAAVISSLFRALTPWAKQYKSQVEHHLSVLLGEPVTINTMETGWYWFEPVIKLNQVAILDGEKAAVKLNKLLVGINLLSSLWHWQIQPGVLFVDDLHLNFHQTDEGWQIDGIVKQKMTADVSSYKPILAWILAQQKIIIKNLSTHIHLRDGTLIPLSDFNLTITNHSGRYRIKGAAHLAQTTATKFQLLADLNLDSGSLDNASGQLFFSAKHLLPAQWQQFIPQTKLQISGGKGDLQLWADLKEGQLKNAQTKLHFHHLAWRDKETKKDQLIQSLRANLAWLPTTTGWQLSGDHVGLRLGETRWPENSLLVRYEQGKGYFLYIKTILLKSLFSTVRPEAVSRILSMEPYGQLHDTQLHISSNEVDYLLTRFSHLGWQTTGKLPAVNNLSGVLHWQPAEGHLEIDSKDTTITLQDKPPVRLAMLNAAFDWKELSHELRISMERFVLSHRDLLLSAQGAVDGLSGPLRLKAEFSANHAERWLAYLPSEHLKPKLDAWLKNEVKAIDKASGELIVNGNIADFPFDNKPGEFSIKSHLSGVDLVFAPQWPITTDIEAYLRVNKRLLEADIVHANFQGIEVNQSNVQVTDLGLDRERLLVHTKARTDSAKALSYVRSTPLKKKLSALAMLQMEGPVELDLQFEVPLYPENDEVLALGDIRFEDATIMVRHSLDNVELKNLNGGLQFNEKGILTSNFQANILNNPVTVLIKSVHEPISATEVKIKGKTTAEVLQQKFKWPFLSLMHGSLWLESLLLLTDDPGDLDHLNIKTSLYGLSVDLPPPLGKKAEANVPLTIDIDFNPQKAVRLRFNYTDAMSGDLWFSGPKGTAFELQKGEIRLGSSKALWQQDQHGLQIIGSLPEFDLARWLRVREKIATEQSQKQLLDFVTLIDVRLRTAGILGETYKDLFIKAVKLEKAWSIAIKQEQVAANLRYQPATNTLTGTFEKLHLDKNKTNFSATTTIKLKPEDMPNLNLSIGSLQLGNLDIGDVSLKTTRLKNNWRLDYCKIRSPFYELTAKGNWEQKGEIDTTRVRSDLHISDLAKTLEQWKISPVIEASRGDIRFQGGWTGRFYDFSLTRLSGLMAINFRNGRITHLSSETEEKLALGKLLSILSLQTIPRRLKLDFSDLSEDGYSFDQFNGNFSIANGIMVTEDSYIDGPVAYASMKGNLDIAKQHYDLDLKVSPHITASLPVVATIAGGPIAGIATWVASKIINHGMQKISGYTYKISGPWHQPVVQQVKIIKKRR
nr:YhdP family protein [Legionella sp. PL877]